MNKSVMLTVALVLLLAGAIWFAVKAMPGQKEKLVSPVTNTKINVTSSPAPNTSNIPASVVINNPPVEIKYGATTNLKQELDSINPQVLDSDFE